ncbi:hypothetical protein ATCC90586_002901 [Pythium insidiosum]|nr:hypothetical protein ATCC90586_002901 [Pythium insidiosum]
MAEPLAPSPNSERPESRPRRVTYTQGQPTVSSGSILASSVGPGRAPQPNVLTTSYLTRLAHDLLGSSAELAPAGAAAAAAGGAGGAGAGAPGAQPRVRFDYNAVEADRASPAPVIGDNDLSPLQYEGQTPDNLVALMPPPIALDTISALSPRRGVRRVRLDSSTVSSTQDVLDSHSPSSDAAYTSMRRTLDPVLPERAVVAGSLRPVVDPFTPAPASSHQRRMTATQHLAADTAGRARRGTAVLLQNDPRGTFRTFSPETARQIFAAQQVRLHDRWLTDVWIYMKNAHPFLATLTAHKWHPYRRADRVLVLTVSLVLALLLCGLFATRDCCQETLRSPIAVVQTRRLRAAAAPDVSGWQCRAFGAACSTADRDVCTQGSSCRLASDGTQRCVPHAITPSCGVDKRCPVGWRCAEATGECQPRESLLCYLPTERRQSVSALSDSIDAATVSSSSSSGGGSTSGGASHTAPIDAISAIASLMKLADEHNQTAAPSTTDVPTPVPTTAPSTSLPSNGSAPTAPSNRSTSSARDQVLITLSQPKNGAVYAVSATLPVAWTVTLLDGDRSLLRQQLASFRVDFSRDGGRSFATVARELRAAVDDASATSLSFRYDWNATLTCDACVLRVCSEGPESVCLRTDGAAEDGAVRSRDGAAVEAAAAPKITFYIVREALACSCGLKKTASFVLLAYLLALVVPVATLVLEQCVTFYQDSKLFGMLARRGAPGVSPMLGFYADEASRRGRALLVTLLLGLCVANGVVVAQINRTRFPGQQGEIAVLWLVTFVLVVVIGFVYCSVLHGAIFALRWRRETPPEPDQSGPVAELARDLVRPASPMQRRLQPNALVAPPPRSTEWL